MSQTRPGVPSDALDIVGGDVAADTRTVTAVVRLAGIPAPDAYSPTGYGYSFRFTVNAGDTPPTFEMSAAVGLGSQLFTLSRRDERTGSTGFGQYIRGVVDETRREVRMSADMSQLQSAAGGALRDPDRRKIAGLQVISGTITGHPSVAFVGVDGDDVATSRKAIRVGDPSCVRLGA